MYQLDQVDEGHSEDASGIGLRLLKLLQEKDIDDIMITIAFWSKMQDYDALIVKQAFRVAYVT
jgi:hypothetical protein